MSHNTVTDIQTDDCLAFPGKPDIIDLAPEDIEWAQKISDLVKLPYRKWKTYLQGLAMKGFETWIQQRQPDLKVNYEDCSISRPYFASVMDAVFNVRVDSQIGSFKVCLIPTAQFTVDEVSIPRAVAELPAYMAHFYIVIGLNEESEVAGIQGFLRYDQLASYQSQCRLDEDWTYTLPINWFTLEPDELLLNLQCLAPAAIPLPKVLNTQTDTLAQLQQELPKVLSHGPEVPLWNVLSWEQGANLLCYPELLELIYKGKTQEESSQSLALELRIRCHELVTLLTQVAINTAAWLDGKLNEIGQNLSLNYGIPPEFGLAAMRCDMAEKRFERAIAYLRDDQGLPIPLKVNSVYQDTEVDNLALRICSTVWANADDAETDWSLLLIVGTQTGQNLPTGTQLRLGNEKGTIHNPQLQVTEPFSFRFS